MEYCCLWIDGQWVKSLGGQTRSIENPATGEVIANVPEATADDVDAAVQAAHQAFYDGRWSRKTPSERSLALLKLADLLAERAEEFARLETENTGKPYQSVSLGADLPFLIDNLRFFAAAARDVSGSHAGEYHDRVYLVVPPRAGRRGRADHTLELPADDGGLEARPGASRRMHPGAQARPGHPLDRPALAESERRSRFPAGGDQCDQRGERGRAGPGRAPSRCA